MSKEYLEINLPIFLKEDIYNLVEGRNKNLELRLDALYNEVQSSINVAFYDERIEQNQANYLRNKYLHQIEEQDEEFQRQKYESEN